MTTATMSPGLRFESRPKRGVPTPLRSDVAGFIGRTRRGPIGIPTRVEGWRGFLREFGPCVNDHSFPRAVRGYFENGGEIAWIVRAEPASTSTHYTRWTAGLPAAGGGGATVAPTCYGEYDICASSPGAWANGLEVQITYERDATDGLPRLHFAISADDEPIEHIRDVIPWITAEQERRGEGLTIESRIAEESRLIRLKPREATYRAVDQDELRSANAPRSYRWTTITLRDSMIINETGAAPDLRRAYLLSADRLEDVPEVAIVAAPGLYEDLVASDRREVLTILITSARQMQDRIVVADAPPGTEALRALTKLNEADALTEEIEDLIDEENGASRAVAYANDLRRSLVEPLDRRAVAVYHPWLWVDGCAVSGRRPIAPSGHVAGAISRSDRERGAHHTPANLDLLDAVDVEETIAVEERGLLNTAGVNLLRCRAGRGLLVWGGRTVDLSREGMFLAHRRLIHRLVRAIRRVAEPIVFDVNGIDLWLMLVRDVGSVLLEVYRRGGLKGERPEEAFQIRCNEALNPISERENGRLLCEIDIAPAVPMEFITIRVELGQTGELEVFET